MVINLSVADDRTSRDARKQSARQASASHLERGGLDDGLVFGAVRVRLIEIGEAVEDSDPARLAVEPTVPWRDVAGMRDHLAHRYFDTAHSIVKATIDHVLPPLVAAAKRLLEGMSSATDQDI